MDKYKLIEQANKYNFNSNFLYNKPYKYSNKEKIRWYFWMCELNFWFNEKYDIHIVLTINPYSSTELYNYKIYKNSPDMRCIKSNDNLNTDKISALYEALIESFKII